MSARGRARTRAVEILFEAEQRHEPALEVMARRRANDDKLIGAYTEEIIRGVLARGAEIDEAVQTWSRGWTLERMPAVDRTVLRVGAWELLYNDDVPDAVAVSEAVGLARELSTDDSPKFVNGLLGRLQSVKPTLLTGAEADPAELRDLPELPDPPAAPQADGAAAGPGLAGSEEVGTALPDLAPPSFPDAEVLEQEPEDEHRQARPGAPEGPTG